MTFARIRTILSSLVTWLTLVATVLGIVIGELEPFADNTVARYVLSGLAVAATVAAVAVAIIRKVTPVLPDAVGVLPVEDSVPVTDAERRLAEQLRAERALTP